MKVIPLTFRPDMLEANRLRRKWQTRRLIKASNSVVLPGTFEQVDLETGRAREVSDELTELRARCAFRTGARVVTVSPRMHAGDLFWTRPPRGRRVDSTMTLRLQAVRACRVQDMSEGDAMAEGIDVVKEYFGLGLSHRARYALLWDAINGAGSWAANPWVWVFEYTVLAKNVADVLEGTRVDRMLRKVRRRK
jgi:hypothetical protein